MMGAIAGGLGLGMKGCCLHTYRDRFFSAAVLQAHSHSLSLALSSHSVIRLCACGRGAAHSTYCANRKWNPRAHLIHSRLQCVFERLKGRSAARIVRLFTSVYQRREPVCGKENLNRKQPPKFQGNFHQLVCRNATRRALKGGQ